MTTTVRRRAVEARGPVLTDPLALATLRGTAEPAVLRVRGWTAVVADPVAVVDDLAGLGRIGALLGWRDPGPELATTPPGALAVGWLSDDLSAGLLGVGTRGASRPAIAPVAPLRFAVHDVVTWVPPDGGPARVVAAHLPGLSRSPAADRAAGAVARLRAAQASYLPIPDPSTTSLVARPSLDRAAHARGVAQTLEWIANGDLYQLNLTFQVTAPWAGGGAALAAALGAATPHAAHAAWLRAPGGVEIASVSPETFLRVEGSRVSTRPIKGTRPRHDQPDQDAIAGAELGASAKDGAEHVMIVDLERNDLGRVCRVGTVRVPSLAALEAHPTVWHLTSTVTGDLRDDVGLDDLIAATFPAGSITGAPKRMAWSRIAHLEPVRRGVYCGAIGVIGPGMVELSVAIRTAVVTDGVASYGAGGGIVADSDPDAEWDEAWDKAAAFCTATGSRRLA